MLRIAAAVIHKGEEPPLVGTGGSGTIFITGCNLGCVFCQNYQVSQGEGTEGGRLGKPVSPEDFAAICAALQNAGAENINIVTGSHAIPALVEGFDAMRKAGVEIPILWNCSAYETQEALELLKNYVDIYLPDLKTLDSKIAAKFFNAPDYPVAASQAILKMIEMTESKEQRTKNKEQRTESKERLTERGEQFDSGVVIRHLVLPGYLESTRSVLRWFADNAKDRALLSLMTQYTPIPGRGDTAPQRYLTEDEYDIVIKWLDEFGIEDGFCQELVTGNDWLPDFKKANPFPSKLSFPVWTV